MAEVQQKEQGGGGKARQKKQTLRVDFTPMVDMNMLLITFFMFCTTLLKPQVMNITMPAIDQTNEENKNKIAESMAVTILLGANDRVYYYEGKPQNDEQYKDPNFLQVSDFTENGIRKILMRKNAGVFKQIQELKLKKTNGELTEEAYSQLTKDIQEKANKDLKAPNVQIKPTDLSTYKNMVDALDEMLVCNIGFYQIAELADGDRHLLYTKTGNIDYLTDELKKDIPQ
ncbi:MAG: biopolymer transporter ExbD [Dysgonamonadaceae bacterium]|jgi:biopolymer transport protein ExbD|nr:biopolymer transporter ExbD [Dysgonamonadaceae bacterium]